MREKCRRCVEASTMAMFIGMEMEWAWASMAVAQALAAARVRVGMGRMGEEERGMLDGLGRGSPTEM